MMGQELNKNAGCPIIKTVVHLKSVNGQQRRVELEKRIGEELLAPKLRYIFVK